MTPYQVRLYEIQWHTMINEFFRYTSAPTALYDYIDMLGLMFDCNRLLLRKATEVAVLNEYQYRPQPMEYAILLVLNGAGVRQVCRELGKSTNTYYNYKHRVDEGYFNIAPKYPEAYRKDVIKCMKGLQKLINIIE